MAKLKKINPEWSPSESRDLKVGEIVEITDYIRLVKGGDAVLVDASGQELALPGEVFTCPICYRKTESLLQFTAHVGAAHSPVKPTVTIAQPEEFISAEEEVQVKRDIALEKVKAAKTPAK